MNTYETERLILKPVSKEDAKFVLELMNSEKWLQNIGERNVKTIEDAEKYIEERMRPQYIKGYYNYLVVNKETLEKMGSCGIFTRDGLEIPDIGFAFLPQFEGKGFAYESAKKVFELGIQNLGITKLSGITLETNHSSRKLLEKLGLIFKRMVSLPDDTQELMYYEWEK